MRHTARRRLRWAAIVAVVAAAALVAISSVSGGTDREQPSAVRDRSLASDPRAAPAHDVDADAHLVAEGAVPLVDVYRSPGDVHPELTLAHPTEVGGPLVFLVEESDGEWLEVRLPVRPNGSTGWVRADQVRLSGHDFEIVVRLSEHRLELYRGGERVFDAAVAVGRRDTPTPGGTFYIKELLEPPDPDTVYGNYAFGLSGFSNVLESFGTGQGVIGIHGTNDPSVIGTDVSAGCIRLTNEDMLELVGTIPLGTPVTILA